MVVGFFFFGFWGRVVVAVVAAVCQRFCGDFRADSAAVFVVTGAVLLLGVPLLQQTAIQLLDSGGEGAATGRAKGGRRGRLDQRVFLA